MQRQLIEGTNEATALDAALFEQFGETAETASDLEQLQNLRQRITNPYSRLCTLLLRVAEFQPMVSAAMLNLLAQTVEQGQAAVNAAQASVQEISRDWNLS